MEKCKDCKYFRKLRKFKSRVKELGGNGIVCGWKVEEMQSYHKDAFCCTVFMGEKDAPIFETTPEDHCENWKKNEESV